MPYMVGYDRRPKLKNKPPAPKHPHEERIEVLPSMYSTAQLGDSEEAAYMRRWGKNYKKNGE